MLPAPNNPTDQTSQRPAQPVLFSLEDIDGYQEEQSPARAGRFTAEQIRARTPDRYALAVELLAAGHGVIHVARLLQMSAHSVRAIREAEPEPIAQQREKLIRRLGVAGGLALESILEDLEDPIRRAKIASAQKAVIFGILNDHALKMTGQPTSITATLESQPGHDEAAAYLARMKPAENQKSRKAAPVEMVCGAESPAAKRGPVQADAEPVADAIRLYSNASQEDLQSAANADSKGDFHDV